MNPLIDESGVYADKNQPSSDVWFLAGCFPNGEKKYPSRTTTIPEGRSILFPVINCSASELEYPHLKTDFDLIDHVKKDMDSILKKDCFINGIRVMPKRIRSEPELFTVTIHKENAFGIEGDGRTITVADEFWVFLKPLLSGEYILSLKARVSLGRLNSGAGSKIKAL